MKGKLSVAVQEMLLKEGEREGGSVKTSQGDTLIRTTAAHCIKLLPEKNLGYFNQSFLPMVKSVVKIMLRFYLSFSSGKSLCNEPLII